MAESNTIREIEGKLVPAVGTWEFDPGHTIVSFEGRHLIVSRIRGTFQRLSGRIQVAEVPEESHAQLEIDAASVESGFKERDEHLRSSDWFDVGRYPTIRFESAGVRHIEGGRWAGSGRLTIRDVTRPIEVDIEFDGGVTDPWGNQKIGATVSAVISLADFGLTWNMPLQAGGFVVGKEVKLTVAIEAVRQASPQPTAAGTVAHGPVCS